MNKLKDIYGLFLVLIGIHYFYSYMILNRYLNVIGLDFLPIISMEDITFSYGLVNYSIINFSLLGFVGIYLWFLFVDDQDEFISRFRKSASMVYNFTMNFIKKRLPEWLPKGLINLLLLGIFLFLASLVFVKIIMPKPNFEVGVLFFILLVVIPSFYILHKSKRNLILIGYVVFIILWGLVYIKAIINKETLLNVDRNSEVTFEFQGNSIKSNKNYFLVYSGYKYIVMRNDSTGRSDLFPMKDVSGITFKNINKK